VREDWGPGDAEVGIQRTWEVNIVFGRLCLSVPGGCPPRSPIGLPQYCHTEAGTASNVTHLSYAALVTRAGCRRRGRSAGTTGRFPLGGD